MTERRNTLVAFSKAVGDDKMRLCPKCGRSLEYISEHGYCCPRGHGCWWPAAEREPPEDRKARCYHQGEIKTTSQSSGRKRKKPPKKSDFSYLYSE